MDDNEPIPRFTFNMIRVLAYLSTFKPNDGVYSYEITLPGMAIALDDYAGNLSRTLHTLIELKLIEERKGWIKDTPTTLNRTNNPRCNPRAYVLTQDGRKLADVFKDVFSKYLGKMR